MIGRWLQHFIRQQRGAAAVEFALIVPILLGLIFSTMEVGWTMVQTIMLDRALDLTVRSLRIGQIANPTQQGIRMAVCKEAMVLADCDNSLALELVPIMSESNYPTDASRCINKESSVAPVLRFNAGISSQTVFVRACFVVSPLTPGLGLALALQKDETGAYRIISKSAFTNEPS